MSQFIQYRSVLGMLGQHYLGEGVAFSPPITFGCKHSYETRRPPWFTVILKKIFSQHWFFPTPGYYMVELFTVSFISDLTVFPSAGVLIKNQSIKINRFLRGTY